MDKAQVIRNKIVAHEALTFDDVLLLPGYTDFRRSDVDISSKLHPRVRLKLPLISSPMDTVTEEAMAAAMATSGALGIIHRNLRIEEQVRMVRQVKSVIPKDKNAAVDDGGALLVGAAVGPGDDFITRTEKLISAGADVIVVDSAHGYSKFVIECIRHIRRNFPKAVVMAGNIATFDGAKSLIAAGAHILRVGMGPGSICTTRIITGMGVPQLSAVSAVVRATQGSRVTVVADGGIRQIGDMAKAFAFGADAVMLGSLLARFDESPGDTVVVSGKKYKTYRGMGSLAAMRKGGAARYGQSRKGKALIAEGVEGLVEYKGSVAEFLVQVDGSLRSSFYYLGASNLKEFFRSSRVIRISNAGLYESHPHTVQIADSGSNYIADPKG
ncbi:hypothetical protein A2Z33_01560 [Candidatus Gottesmanbacteria bacterium RBG_16_52_11]|uniref:IMP dehydrogenase/GMP reductase domain-containing protein n=1 Tax=Candidatus Gottesmanbacteria bacterium RBG_16_52_11 TaxID=1798374 RepID=A0A1F5YPJ2_9BACT|nr:MAG: hypothetical protein A2Z33_01560 [Candidatus Gottesmanbacteria bacterium RBG_16_52_11]